MAASDSIKPFSPEETQRILHHLQQPAVFMNMTCGWPVLHWTAEHLSGCLGDKLVRFRLGRKDETNAPLFETQCSYVEAKLAHFLSWTQNQAEADVGPLCVFPNSEYWAYADYKYIAMLFEDQPSMFEDVRWADFGYEGRNGRESTIWIGTEGANTPCHLDSYGCNLVLQVQGRKRWHLFPPEDTVSLYPTRIPYEESSVFSQVDVLNPDLRRFPVFQRARAHVVTLQPGQVLYVPRHWWHYVESVDPVTVSVNSWIELEADNMARVSEAVTKAVVCALKSAPSDDNNDDWLNPTELVKPACFYLSEGRFIPPTGGLCSHRDGVSSHDDNMQYVNLSVRAFAQRQKSLRHSKVTQDSRDTRPAKRDSSGQIRKQRDLVRGCAPFSLPFGPHLIPVHCRQEHSTEMRAMTSQDAEGSSGAAPVCPADRGQHECNPRLTQCRPRDCADGPSENSSADYEEAEHTTITTNDLLDCLVHPDIIARVTKLLLERHTGSHRTIPSQP